MIKKFTLILILLILFLNFFIGFSFGKFTAIAETNIDFSVIIEEKPKVCKDEFEVYYSSLAEALENRKGDISKITLLTNISEESTIATDSTVYLDLGNFTVQGSFNVEGNLYISDGTIKNTSSNHIINSATGFSHIDKVNIIYEIEGFRFCCVY